MGIIGMLGAAGLLVVAAPLFVFGVTRSLTGDPTGYLALVVALLFVGLPTVLPNPLDPGHFLEKVVGRVVHDPDAEE